MKLLQSTIITNEEASKYLTADCSYNCNQLYLVLKEFNFEQHELLSILNLKPNYIALYSIVPDIESRFTTEQIKRILAYIDAS